jgi:hypothetical protein
MTKRRPSVRSTMVKVAALSCAAAVAVGGGLSLQLAHGNDPALGPKVDAITAARKARPKRIIKTTVVRKEMAPKPSPATGAAPTTSSVPTTSAPAAPAAPAPVAPAPAPAPVTTSAS